MKQQLIDAVEAFLADLHDITESEETQAPPPRSGNRTPAVTTYNGGDVFQDIVDCLRRAVRKSREGVSLSKAERKVMRTVLKRFKHMATVRNTNGHDVFTHNGL